MSTSLSLFFAAASMAALALLAAVPTQAETTTPAATATQAAPSTPSATLNTAKQAHIIQDLERQILVIEDVKSCVRAAKSESDLHACRTQFINGRRATKMCE